MNRIKIPALKTILQVATLAILATNTASAWDKKIYKDLGTITYKNKSYKAVVIVTESGFEHGYNNGSNAYHRLTGLGILVYGLRGGLNQTLPIIVRNHGNDRSEESNVVCKNLSSNKFQYTYEGKEMNVFMSSLGVEFRNNIATIVERTADYYIAPNILCAKDDRDLDGFYE